MKLASKTIQGLLVLSAVALGQSAHAQIVGFNDSFDVSADYSGRFLRNSDSAVGSTGLNWGAAAGTNGGGGLIVTETAARNIFYRPSPASNTTSVFDITSFTVGNVFSSSIDFKWADTTSISGTHVITAGFTASNSSQSALSSTGSLGGSILRSGSSTVTLRMRSDNANVGSVLTFNQSALTAGNWYRLSFDLTKTATANTFNYTLSLFSIGANGTSNPVLFNDGTNNLTITGSVANSVIYADSDAFFAYDIRGGTAGISNVDNFVTGFAAVPEPSSAALLLGGIALMTGAGRRRRAGSKA